MKDLHLAEEHDCDAGARALLHLCAKGTKERLELSPGNVARHRMGKNGRKGSFVPTVHSNSSITLRY